MRDARSDETAARFVQQHPKVGTCCGFGAKRTCPVLLPVTGHPQRVKPCRGKVVTFHLVYLFRCRALSHFMHHAGRNQSPTLPSHVTRNADGSWRT